MRPTSKPASDAGDTGRSLPAPLVVTAGEPAGIGPDLCLALADTDFSDHLVVIADPRQLQRRAELLGIEVHIHDYQPGAENAPDGSAPGLCVLAQQLPQPQVCGEPHSGNSRPLLDALTRATSGCLSGEFSGLVTAPLQKSIINDAGINFTGHTEFLAEASGCQKPVMLLVADTLRVALASTHMPLREVADYVTTDLLLTVIEVLQQGLKRHFRIADPEIIVCGLNPHAGEGGHLGREDEDVIAPAIRESRARGCNVRGPLPADTAFTPAAGNADAVLAMYHDQGLPVLKYAGFGNAVNVTLGLPFVRTSVDHGTALDIAGSGQANTGSMLAAVELALTLASE